MIRRLSFSEPALWLVNGLVGRSGQSVELFLGRAIGEQENIASQAWGAMTGGYRPAQAQELV